jgi:protein gp37
MGKDSKIQWTHHTHNPWRGCRKVADECKNCYIVTTPPFRTTGQTHGSTRVRAGEAALREPLSWNRAAEKANERRRVFCLSLGDWLDDENVPIWWLADLLGAINDTPNLDWLLLTKRPQNWHDRVKLAYETQRSAMDMNLRWLRGTPPPNVWIGVSAGADQSAALDIPAKIHFLSCEPMLRPMDSTHAAKFGWIILGGESGHNARECHIEWIREGVQFCREHDVRCFVKQLGAKPISSTGWTGPLKMIHDKKGGDINEWPEDLRIREFPTSV